LFADFQQQWAEYYGLRRSARIAALALPALIALLSVGPIAQLLGRLLLAISLPFQVVVVLSVIGLATVLVAVPILDWARWRCPQCGHSFVQPRATPAALFLVFRRLIVDSPCATCKLECGSNLAPSAAHDSRPASVANRA